MGHRNSSAHIHDAVGIYSDGGGSARFAASASSLNVTAVKMSTSKRVWTSRAAAWLLLTGIRFYQAVFAPVMPLGCKFYPSCSHYAPEAIARHGAAHGVWLAAARLCLCRPFTLGGFDPVPDIVPDVAGVVWNSAGNQGGIGGRS